MKQGYFLFLRAFLVLATTVAAGGAYAQDALFSQYYAAPLYLNPGLTSVSPDISFNANYRSQWRALGDPITAFQVSGTTPLKNRNPRKYHKQGVGGSIFNERAGAGGGYRAIGGLGSYGYNLPLTYNYGSMLSLGVQAGVVQRSLDAGQLTWGSQYNSDLGNFDKSINPTINGQLTNSVVYPILNIGGVWYINPQRKTLIRKFTAFNGLSVNNINRPNQALLKGQSEIVPMLYRLHGGFEFKLNKALSLAPNYLFMRQRNADQYNVGAYLTYRGLYNYTDKSATQTNIVFGTWYRLQDSFIFSAGVSGKAYSVGLSYDVNYYNSLSEATNARGALELSASYRIVKKVTVKRFSTPIM
jgi:type IX secretion system PorP/SprF family membrane protein